ncbi:MAG: class I SAM-dependent RNA methyltransferase [Pseudomonadota bacterium]|nr:class I SAM-dependent RNA methyltransferase [Pseudomonadota bacterium]
MSENEAILRVAAKGDGVTASGRFVAGAAPGDVVLADGSLEFGPQHATPPCRHYGVCGGCQLQHLNDDALANFVSERVVNAALGQGLVAERVAPSHLSPPGSRRRAVLHAAAAGGRVELGYREAASHRLVDLAECPVLVPELAALIAPLRRMLARQGAPQGKSLGKTKGKPKPAPRFAADIELALADQGPDVAIKGLSVEGLAATEALLDFARDQHLARLTLDQGYGPEALWEPEPVTVTLSGVAVALPPGGFLQATADGEAVLTAAATQWLAGCGAVADLFSGLGTFAFALAGQGGRVLAVEAEQRNHLACKMAAARAQLPIHAAHRDLFRNPLQADELAKFDAVLLDPPRAGARDQIARLAASDVARVAYISCNPASWARDAATLTAGGYRLVELRPVGQFRWSTHVELASLFVK